MADETPTNPEPPNPHRQLIVYGEKTRFGAKDGPDPRAAKAKQVEEDKCQNQHSIRGALKRLMVADFDISKPITPSDLVKKFGRDGALINGAQVAAMNKFMQAMKNWKAMDSLIDAVDGKQKQSVELEAKRSLGDIILESYQEPEQVTKDESGSRENKTVA